MYYLHDVQKVVVDLRLVAELELDLVQVGQSILNLTDTNDYNFMAVVLKNNMVI